MISDPLRPESISFFSERGGHAMQLMMANGAEVYDILICPMIIGDTGIGDVGWVLRWCFTFIFLLSSSLMQGRNLSLHIWIDLLSHVASQNARPINQRINSIAIKGNFCSSYNDTQRCVCFHLSVHVNRVTPETFLLLLNSSACLCQTASLWNALEW